MVRIFALCLLATACASPVGSPRLGPQAQLVPGVAVSAPDGLNDYCARVPAECASGARHDLRGRISATGAATLQSISFRANSQSSTPDSIFDAMMAARLGPRVVDTSATSSRMSLTPARWQELRAVNRAINRAIRPVTDRTLYGVEEFWQRPLLVTGRGAQGDCEDYALEKRARLLALGWSPDMLAMAVAVAPRIGLHATLIVQTDQGDFVLDNLSSEPRRLGDLDYLWISRQVGPSLNVWASADVVGASVSPRSPAYISPEAMFERMMGERTSLAIAAPVLAPVVSLSAVTRSEASERGGKKRTPLPRSDLEPVLLPAFYGSSSYFNSQTRQIAP